MKKQVDELVVPTDQGSMLSHSPRQISSYKAPDTRIFKSLKVSKGTKIGNRPIASIRADS